MKRTELRRSTPLRAGRQRESKRVPLPSRSAKTQAVYRQRRPLVAKLLEARPICERCVSARSDDVHEVKSRARGGSILDESNLRCLCRPCHTLITAEPALAEVEGWSVPSWWRSSGDACNVSRGDRSWS